jgi:PHD/YefM family antitoxin component YafN of YafNO toxin-antitoxin module
MKIIKSSALRKNLKNYLIEVSESKEPIIIPRSNNLEDDSIVMITLKEYTSLKANQEMNYLLSTKANRDRLNESLTQLEGNNIVEFDEDEFDFSA